MPTISVDKYASIQCGRCVLVCPGSLLAQKSPKHYPEPIPDADSHCIACGHCVAICPVDAMEIGSLSGRDCEPLAKETAPRFEHIATLVRGRRSVRRFVPEPVDPQQIEQLIDVVRWAPTARNALPVRWTVVHSPETVRELAGLVVEFFRRADTLPELVAAWDAGYDGVLRDAPCLVIASAGKDALWPEVDCTIAVETLDLCATAMRLGACWAGYFIRAAAQEPTIAQRLGFEDGERVYAALMIGRPLEAEVYSRAPYRPQPSVRWIS